MSKPTTTTIITRFFVSSDRMMLRNVRTTFFYVLASVFFLAFLYHHLFHQPSSFSLRPSSYPPPSFLNPLHTAVTVSHAIHEHFPAPTSTPSLLPDHVPPAADATLISPPPASVPDSVVSTVAVLLPAWEVLLIVSPDGPSTSDSDGYLCLFHKNATSPAVSAGVLPSPNRKLFKCDFPSSSRRRFPFLQPVLTKSAENHPLRGSPRPEMLRWNFLVYDSFTTGHDVVLFVKGINNRQGGIRDPAQFRCVFFVGDSVSEGVRTTVTSSAQEVFRCQKPEPTGLQGEDRIRISLEILEKKIVVPSVAYYAPQRKVDVATEKPELCACTMVYNVAKFLKEWVIYHSSIGVDKFILYDNGSDDGLDGIVAELVADGYDVNTLFWFWPKTQEAGFSHAAVYAKDSCKWMVFIDVDEFVYSPFWDNASAPSKSMLPSIHNSVSSKYHKVGEVMIECHEFGPSNQKSNPPMGVMEGYDCRRRSENRHKSIVMIDAIDESLLNVVHHFSLKKDYKVKKLSIKEAVVNHYKFQAWPEFKAKFRRRVSAYVVDWTQATNLASNDRTPGLGFSAVEPSGWPQKFCEVADSGLKNLALRWFRTESQSGERMAWQR